MRTKRDRAGSDGPVPRHTLSVADLAAKIEDALLQGVHVLLLDLLPPGLHDPQGLHGALWRLFDAEEFTWPPEKPLTLVSYVGVPKLEAHLNHLAVGDPLPDMPLFLHSERYIFAPLEATYQAAFRGLPAYWRAVLEKMPTA